MTAEPTTTVEPTTVAEPGASAGEQELMVTPWAVLDDYQCFGCSPHNATGLQLRFRVLPDGLGTVFRLGSAHESYPGVVHGGLAGVICDETMGNLIVLRTGTPAFTTAMRLRYLAPIPVGAPHECRARIVSTGDTGLINAEADILDATGGVVATARATYRPVALEAARDRITLSDGDAGLLADVLRTSTLAAVPATTSVPATAAVPATTSLPATASEES
ncbi:PaaI family thioesterase [Parafrankia discariae]|uniref:PaaI family thioesterase n=1 Tax=Parafrankia discariae TaxID=365528 RepID=UPI000369A435|nr:hotdog domain-containing protein [Parafrankia discariae]